MTEATQSTSPSAAAPQGSSATSNSSEGASSWIPPIPRPLQRIFDLVPLVTYSANELPYRSPAVVDDSSSLPTLHVFTTQDDAAKGWPSFNPSCLKWQTYLRIAGVPHNLTPSTNHASPTGSLPFLLPALSSNPAQRLDTRPLLPIPSSRLETYAARHVAKRKADQTASASSEQTEEKTNHDDNNVHTKQAYQSLLDTPIRNAWLYTLYLSPANEPLLRKLYLNPVSRASIIQKTILSQLRRAARSEIAKTTITATPTKRKWSIQFGGGGDDDNDDEQGGSGGFLLHDILTWAAVGGQPTIDPALIYDEARNAFAALEGALTLLPSSPSNVSWFFNTPKPTLFDAAVFSYTYLILSTLSPEDEDEDPKFGQHQHQHQKTPWRDDTLRRILLDECPLLRKHASRVIDEYWGDVPGLRALSSW